MRIPSLFALTLLASPLSAQSLPVWQAVREATFGSPDDPKTAFSDIRGIGIASTGNVLVLDYKSQDLRVFSPTGSMIRTSGRNGQGPGEFKQPNGVARAPDGNFWINDFPNRRFSVHRESGEFLRNVPSSVQEYGYIWDGMFDASGRLLLSFSKHDPAAGAKDKPERMLERRAISSGKSDTIPYPHCMPPSQENAQRAWIWERPNAAMYQQIPFSSQHLVAMSRRDYAWCTMGREYIVYRLGLARGDTQVVIRGKAPSIPVTTQERDSAVDAAKAAFRKANADESVVKAGDVPRTRPAIIDLVVDNQDRLWVRRTPSVKDHTVFDVYDAAGKGLGTVEFPVVLSQSPSPVIVGDKVYAVVRDDDDVPMVVRFRVGKQ